MSAYKKGVRIQATIAPIVSKDIDDLLATGLFGLNRAEIIQRFIYDGVRRNIEFLRATRRGKLPGSRGGIGPAPLARAYCPSGTNDGTVLGSPVGAGYLVRRRRSDR